GNQIRHGGVVHERLMSVCETLRHVKLEPVLRRQFEGYPLPASRRIGPQIDDDIVYRALDAGDDLYLGMRLALEVDATQGMLPAREREGMLDEFRFQPARAELLDTEAAREKAPFV